MRRACLVLVVLCACVAEEGEEKLSELQSALETPTYLGVFRAGSGATHVTGLTWSSFVSTWQQNSANGLRLVDIDIHGPATALVVDAVFHPGTDSYYLWRADAAGLQQKANELLASNLFLVDLESYVESDGSRRFVGVWRYGTGTQSIYLGDTQATLDSRIANAIGVRLATFDVYVDNDTVYYNSVFRTGDDSYTWVRGVTWNTLSRRWSAMSSKRIADLQTYTRGGVQYYSAIFRTATDAHTLVASTNDFETKAWRARSDGLIPTRLLFDPSGVQLPPTFAAKLETLDIAAKGYSFAIIDDSGRISAEGGIGWARAPTESVTPGIKMSSTSRVHVASMSKTITAVTVLKLVEQGLINLDEPFIRYTPFTSYSSDVGHVLVRDVLQHKSGMENGECAGDLTADMARHVMSRLVGEPGVTYLYSNSNYCLLRVVIEHVSRQPYVDFVQKEILAPLGLTGMSCKPELSSPTLYYSDASDSIGTVPTDHTSDCAAFGWLSSAREYAQFAAAVHGGRVINSQLTRTMFDELLGFKEVGSSAHGVAYGHGGIWGYGDGGGARTSHMGGPHGIITVLLINTHVTTLNLEAALSAGFSDLLVGNVSQGRTATQSSTDGSHVASLAVDGSRYGNAFDNQYTATLTTVNPWWQVDLASSQMVGEVVVWPRDDLTAPPRLLIELSPNGTSWTPYTDVTSYIGIQSFRPRSSARYVRVRPMSSSPLPLQLAEVRVWTY